VKLDGQTKKMIITNIPHFFDKELNFSLKIKYLDSYYGIPSINLKLSPKRIQKKGSKIQITTNVLT
ncbi:MAG: hypothetical protein WCR36_08520, partial [Bacteroidaceae bacterium]